MADIRVGDRVEITLYRRFDDDYNGRTGTVAKIDTDDVPYYVSLEGETYSVWAEEVRRIGATTDREAFVALALELLKGTPHTGADVIAMAAFLAGE